MPIILTQEKMMSNRNTKIAFLIAAAAIVTILILVFVFVFRIEKVEVTGNSQYTKEEIEDYIFEKQYEKNTILLFIESLLGNKKEIAFVEDYDVEITSYNAVRITIYEKSIVGYIEYMGANMYFDKDGVVVESSTKVIENVPKITGLQYDYVLLHEKLPVENDMVFDQLLDITQMLEKYSLGVDKIYITKDFEVTLYIEKVKVEMGNSDMNEKMIVLNDLHKNLEGHSGTLDMKELSEDGNYTLKKD